METSLTLKSGYSLSLPASFRDYLREGGLPLPKHMPNSSHPHIETEWSPPKKTRIEMNRSGDSLFILKIAGKTPSTKIADSFTQAGVLTDGSPYSPPLPIIRSAYCQTRDSGHLRLSSPITAAGPSSTFTRFPFKPFTRHLGKIYCVFNGCY